MKSELKLLRAPWRSGKIVASPSATALFLYRDDNINKGCTLDRAIVETWSMITYRVSSQYIAECSNFSRRNQAVSVKISSEHSDAGDLEIFTGCRITKAHQPEGVRSNCG